MASIVLERETKNYWDLIKDAGTEVKLALISLLSSSMSKDADNVVIEVKPTKAKRLHKMTDEQLANEIDGDPILLGNNDGEPVVNDLVEANSGRLEKGLEKWL